jgi:Rieske Fe-S protein
VRYALPAADGVSIDSSNEVILCRSNGEVYAFALSCPHQNTALKAMPKNAGFQCTRHKSKYLPNGTFVSGRATRNMDRLHITRDGAQIIVDPDLPYESDLDPAKWAAAFVKI